MLPLWASLLEGSGERHVIELGAGCGIVGIYLASTFPNCNCVLTDLPEATEIMRLNMGRATPAVRGKVSGMVLDWEEELLPLSLQATTFDLIAVSDCTYNCDTVPALVRTMTLLVSISPSAIVLVAMKVRHESEAVFFKLMTENGFVQIEHVTASLADR